MSEHIRPQLPADKAAPNLAYLETVFQAIREGRPGPQAGPDVFPALVKVGRSMLAPETLDFVRATLDLDPWPLAVRAGVPVALVWGDRDIQAGRPAALPPGFQGTVLVIPEANHLLKRETRPRAGLDGASALAGYGDEVPLADLAPVAAWIKGLD